MPPRGRGAADPEKKLKDYNEFLEGEEYKLV